MRAGTKHVAPEMASLPCNSIDVFWQERFVFGSILYIGVLFVTRGV